LLILNANVLKRDVRGILNGRIDKIKDKISTDFTIGKEYKDCVSELINLILHYKMQTNISI